MNGTLDYGTAVKSTMAVTRRAALYGFGAMSLTAILARQSASAAAQDATPPAPTGAVGISIEMMGVGPPVSAPGLELTLRRTVLAPGGRLPDHTHPGALVIYVESGAFGYIALGGTAQMTRAAVDGTVTPPETMPVGTEVVLMPGDWLFVEDPRDDIRNAGEEDVVLLVAGLTRIGDPFTTFMEGMDMSATPAS